MNLTEDEILALAPDDASRKSGKGLANPADWVSIGANDAAIWGECQGSGSKPYQTQVDIRNIAFKCTCPSRKFPCKHGLGLMLYNIKNKAAFEGRETPQWVKDWIDKRTARVEKAEEPAKPVDEVAQAKRQQARTRKVDDGVEELLLWIKDLIRNGLIAIPGKEASLQNMGKRMIDAQAGGLAGFIRSFEDINFHRDGWQGQFLDKLATMYLLIAGYKNIEAQAPELQQEIKSIIGFPQNLEEIRERKGIKDDWFVMGRQLREDDQLTIERNWLYGLHSGQYALILNFIVNNQVKEVPLTPGTVLEAELVFFNPGMSLRALIKQRAGMKKEALSGGLPNWNAVMNAQAAVCEKNPFMYEFPLIVDDVRPVLFRDQWWLQDRDNNMVQIKLPNESMWKFLAISGSQPATVTLVGRDSEYVPLGTWIRGEYKIFF